LKNKQKKSNSPDLRRGHRKKALLHLLRLAGFTLALLLLLALFHLLTLGLPDPLTQSITARLQENGIPVHIESITLSVPRGWVLHNIQLYSPSPDDIEPIFQAKKLYVRAWPQHGTDLSRTGWNLNVYGKEIDVSLGAPWENKLDEDHPFRTLDRLKAHLYIGPGYLSIEQAELLWGDYIFRASGQAELPKQKKQTGPESYSVLQTRATQAADALARLTFDSPPDINFTFNVPADHPEQSELDINFFASGLRHQGRLYDHIGGSLKLQNNTLKIDSVQVTRKNGERLSASGTVHLKDRVTQIRIQNSLQSSDLLGLLPARVASDLARAELQLFGAAEFEAVLGPAPLDQLLQTVQLDVQNLQIVRKDLTLDPVQLNLVRAGSQLKISDIHARANGQPLEGSFEINLDTRAWSTHLQGGVLPYPIGTLTGGGFKTFIDRFKFTGEPPDIRMNLSHSGVKGSLRLDGIVSGSDFLCAGVPLDSCETAMTYSNRVLVLTGLSADHAGKHFSGDIEIDFAQKLVAFDAVNEFPPNQIAQVVAPDHPTILNQFSFNGPIHSEGKGQLDYGDGVNHRFDGVFTAENVSFAGLKADQFDSDISGRGSELIFSNTSAQLFGGFVEGGATFDLEFNDDTSPYRLDIDATEITLAALVGHFSTKDYSKTKGRLSATFKLTADAKAGFWASANGRGVAEIEKGQLRDLPILGGFSKLVRTTLPGFSLFSLTTFYSEYELRDGTLRSENLQLGGTLFSVRARGKYSPQKGLDFTVRAEPLRQTRENKKWYQIHLWIADAIKQGTAPLFDLLEFRLEGTLEKPTWRMNALPKEAYELLRKLNPSSKK